MRDTLLNGTTSNKTNEKNLNSQLKYCINIFPNYRQNYIPGTVPYKVKQKITLSYSLKAIFNRVYNIPL